MPPVLRRTGVVVAVLGILAASCSQASVEPDTTGGSLATFTSEELTARLEKSDRPLVVNVWASWCIPCRSEAPLLVAAHETFGDRVEFLGVAIRDTDTDASAFLTEFGIAYENLLDPGDEIRKVFGGSGVPMTYFVAPGGELVSTHFGVIDDQELALGIDELLRRG